MDGLNSGAHSGSRHHVTHHSPGAESNAYREGGRDGPFRDHGKRTHHDLRAWQRSHLSGASRLEGMPAIDALVGVILHQKRARFRERLRQIGRDEALEIETVAQHFERHARAFARKDARANPSGGLFDG